MKPRAGSRGPGAAAVVTGRAASGVRRAVLALALAAACHRTNISRAQWQALPREQKTLYVRTLLGHEQAKAAKGGNERVFTRPAEEYARRIDDAYARGDARTADAIFEEMGTRR